ncbi:MAG: undecaprenyl-phosphate glucose phosphotransferase [Roseiflexaceae bacterium]
MAAISSVPRPRAESARAARPRSWVVRLLLTLILMLCDALAVNAAFVSVYIWRLKAGDLSEYTFSGDIPFPLFLGLFNLAFLVTFFVRGMYTNKRGASRVDEAFKVAVTVSLSTFAVFLINTALPQIRRDIVSIPWSPQILLFGWAAATIAVTLLRVGYRSLLYALRQRGTDIRRVLIVGGREPGQVVYETIKRLPKLGYRVVGFLSDSVQTGSDIRGIPVLGQITSLGRVIRATQADEVIIALSGRSSPEILDIVSLAEDESVDIKLYPDAFQLITNNEISVGDISGLPLINVKNVALDNPLNRVLKRALDLAVALTTLVLFSPIMLLIALLIKMDSPGPVFFVQERVGLDGNPFPCIKFRGMRADAANLANWTTRDDPRVTYIGAFLRRYSLDELPQFMNVLRGEMSVVGPRPEQQIWVEHFSQSIPRYVRRHKQKAGITGWAQVNGLRGDTSIEERTRYDLYYIENWSLLFDLRIIIKTIIGIITGDMNGY